LATITFGRAEASVPKETFFERAWRVYTVVTLQALGRTFFPVLDAPPAMLGDNIFPCDRSFAPAPERARAACVICFVGARVIEILRRNVTV
jgi:hypothetical protein